MLLGGPEQNREDGRGEGGGALDNRDFCEVWLGECARIDRPHRRLLEKLKSSRGGEGVEDDAPPRDAAPAAARRLFRDEPPLNASTACSSVLLGSLFPITKRAFGAFNAEGGSFFVREVDTAHPPFKLSVVLDLGPVV